MRRCQATTEQASQGGRERGRKREGRRRNKGRREEVEDEQEAGSSGTAFKGEVLIIVAFLMAQGVYH